MKKTSVLMAASLAIVTATALASGATALGSTVIVQEAQANPCSVGDSTIGNGPTSEADFDCVFSGFTEITEGPPPE